MRVTNPLVHALYTVAYKSQLVFWKNPLSFLKPNLKEEVYPHTLFLLTYLVTTFLPRLLSSRNFPLALAPSKKGLSDFPLLDLWNDYK